MDEKNWPGMKEKQLRQHAKCTGCGKKIGETSMPLFYTLKIERWGIDLNALRRQTGMEMMMGGSVMLAQAMGPNEDLAKALMDPVTATICEDCSTEPKILAALVERAQEVLAS